MKSRQVFGLAALACSLALLMQLGPQPAESKKIKIKLKDLKKVKKYAYLLAGQRKKFYAIPFPFPLPVFVKRQQIYTQMPVIYRQVSLPAAQHEFGPYEDSVLASQQSADVQQAPAVMHSSGAPTKSPSAHHRPRPQPPGRLLYSQLGAALNQPGARYLGQLASALASQAPVQPLGLGANSIHRDVLGKLLSGQAKVLAPSSLLTSLKEPILAPPAEPHLEPATHEPEAAAQAANKTVGSRPGDAKESAAADQKPSASEWVSRQRTRQLRPYALPFAASAADPYRLASMLQLAPLANQLAVPNLPLVHPAAAQFLGAGPLAHLYDAPLASQQDSAGQQQDLQEAAASSWPEAEAAQGRRQHQARSLRLNYQLQEQRQRYLSALQELRNRQELSQQQPSQQHEAALSRLELAREQEAMRLAESRAILIRAQQLGLPATEQLRLLRYYRPQMDSR